MIKGTKRSVKKKANNIKPQKSEKSQLIRGFPIVAIGASAGGLEAFEKLFRHVSPGGIAYIIITHLDRDHISILPELIQKCTSIPVVTIKSGVKVKPDTIYVIPPRTNIIIKNGVLTFTKQIEPHYKNLPISLFLQSLAMDKGENAIGVILSGSGEDGATGIRDINEYGGLTIVQNPATAAYDSMPRAAINTGLVDYVMNAEDIAQQLKKYLTHGKNIEGKRSPELQQVLSILRAHTGHDFTNYKLNTVLRRIEKQMFSHHINTLAEYVSLLRKEKSEIDNLLGDLLIGVTRFFRDTDAFDFIKNDIMPQLMKKLPKNYCIRVWVAACSTGEEAYSIAILLRECMDELGKDFNIQIFATDIDLNALNVARSGIYPESIAADVSPERLKRFFTKELNHYKVKSDIRTKVIFGEQNIIKDPPFTKLDFISCRNLLIYLEKNLQKKILPLFHYSLKPNGILFLGISETIAEFTDYFELIGKKFKVFRRKFSALSPRAMLGFDVIPRSHDLPQPPVIDLTDKNSKSFIQAIQTFILENYTSPCLVINEDNNIIYTHGSPKHYLKNSEKKTDLSLSHDLYEDVKIALIPLIHRVRVKKLKLIYKHLQIKIARKTYDINLHVIPINAINELRNHILIIFEDNAKEDKNLTAKKKSSLKNTSIKQERLIHELQNTKENLQTTIEELEAGNEELQSANEELQSTNEEIETSKEELQSLNEELIIVNSELQGTIDQLANVNDDMSNLFNSTEIAAFFLDTHLRIKRYTPKAQEFMHLIQTDIGRSFSHFTTNIKEGKQIVKNAELVLTTLAQKCYDVESEDNRWFNIRILPYRTLTNMIDGVVITLTDITIAKERENELMKLNQTLKNALRYTENIINIADIPVLVLDTNYIIMTANNNFYDNFKISAVNVIDKSLYDVKDNIFDIEDLRKHLVNVESENTPIRDLVIELNNGKLENKLYKTNAHIIPYIKSDEKLIFLSLEPTT